jgi:hypothetical protein
MKKMKFVVLSIFICFGTHLHAQNIHRTDVIALGMGNAYIANGRDFNAFLYNPALLARMDKKFQIEFANATFGFSNNIFSKLNFLKDNQEDFVNFQANAISTDPELRSRAEKLQAAVAEQILSEPTDVSFSPSVVIKWWHFGFAAYTDWSYGFVMDFPGIIDRGAQRFDPPSARTRGEQDIALILGYGTNIKWIKGLALGGSFKFFRRRLAQRRLSALEFDNVIDLSQAALSQANYFTRFGLDFGGTYVLGNKLTIGFVMNDIIKSNNFIDVTPLYFSLGFTYEFSNALIASLDINDLFDRVDNKRVDKAISFEETDRVRIGLQYFQLQFSNVSFPLRAGIGGGFITGGLSIVPPQFGKFDFRFDYAITNSPKIDELAHFLQIKLKFKL